jgi:DNA-directed RNA polymerase subunit K/omega
MGQQIKKPTVSASIVTRDTEKIAEPTGNVYEGIVIISKRARQISTKMKEELNNKLADFASTVDNLEEIFENREQIEISRFYERMPKPSSHAMEEFLEGKVFFRNPDTDATSQQDKA